MSERKMVSAINMILIVGWIGFWNLVFICYSSFLFFRHVHIENEIRKKEPMMEYATPNVHRHYVSIPGFYFIGEGLEYFGVIEDNFEYGQGIHYMRLDQHHVLYNLSHLGGILPPSFVEEMYWELSTGG